MLLLVDAKGVRESPIFLLLDSSINMRVRVGPPVISIIVVVAAILRASMAISLKPPVSISSVSPLLVGSIVGSVVGVMAFVASITIVLSSGCKTIFRLARFLGICLLFLHELGSAFSFFLDAIVNFFGRQVFVLVAFFFQLESILQQ